MEVAASRHQTEAGCGIEVLLGINAFEQEPLDLRRHIGGNAVFVAKLLDVGLQLIEQICIAVVSMLSRIGIKVDLLAQTKTKFFTKINAPNYDTPFFMLGWTPATYDVHNMLVSLLHTRAPGGAGFVNDGGYSNPKLDALIDKIQVETDKAARAKLVHDALEIVKNDIPTIPLHQQAVVWATRDNIQLTQLADDFFPFRYVTVK